MTTDKELGEEYGESIMNCVLGLMQREPGEDRFRIFDAICYIAENAFVGIDYSAELRSGNLTPKTLDALVSQPAAGPLLAYFVEALVTYNSVNAELVKSDTHSKREALLSVFRLTGSPGKSYENPDERMALESFFRGRLDAAVKRSAGVDAVTNAEHLVARRRAMKETFAYKYGTEHRYDSETHKSQMRRLKIRLKHIQHATDEGDGAA